jgi:hypothetical protein
VSPQVTRFPGFGFTSARLRRTRGVGRVIDTRVAQCTKAAGGVDRTAFIQPALRNPTTVVAYTVTAGLSRAAEPDHGGGLHRHCWALAGASPEGDIAPNPDAPAVPQSLRVAFPCHGPEQPG